MIVVKGKFPQNAHRNMPADVETVVVSKHINTQRGAINAWKSYQQRCYDYAISHGNGAVYDCWIEVNGKRFDDMYFEIEYDLMFTSASHFRPS